MHRMDRSPAAPAPPRPGTTRFAPLRHYRLAYEAVDPPPAPDGSSADAATTVVLLHGLLAGRAEWAAARDALAAAGRRVLLPEARGHGASAGLADRRYAAADLAAEVAAVLDAAGVAAAHLVGHGLGGAAAFATAVRYPDRLRSLVLVEPDLPAVLDGDPDPALLSARNAARRSDRDAADAAYKGLTDRALDRYLDPRWGSGWRERLARPRLGAVRRHAASLAGTLDALDGLEVGAEDTAAVPVPTLVACRLEAPPLVRGTAARLAARLPGCRLVDLPAALSPEDPLGGPAGVALVDLLVGFVTEADGR